MNNEAISESVLATTKTKIVPLKAQLEPRLELKNAVLGAKSHTTYRGEGVVE